MPTDRLLPAAIATDDDWSLGAGGSKPVAVQTNDDDTTYISVTNNNVDSLRETFYVDALESLANQISQVDVASRSRRTSGINLQPRTYVRVGASTQAFSTTVTGSYATETDADISRPGGGNWVPADFPGGSAGAEIGVDNFPVDNTNVARCTWLYFDVTYSTVQSGAIVAIFGWLPPLIAAASHCLSRREVAWLLRNLKTRPSNDHDFRRILEAFQVRPRFVGV